MIKIAVVGIGRWGAHLLRNFLNHSQAEVVAVVDPTPERLAVVKEQYNLNEEVVLITEWEAIKQVAGLEAVVIATPASTHYTLITDALNWGYHVLAEKPLTLNPVESRKVCHLAEKHKRQLMVDHTYLFHPAVQRGQTILQAGELGELRYGYATRTHNGPVRQDVDALWDLAIHDIGIFNTWLGALPVKVQATGTVWLQPGIADLVWVTLTYPNGFQAFIHLCWLNPDKQRRLGVVGNCGSLIFDEMSHSSPLTLIKGEFQRIGNQFIPVNQIPQALEIETEEPLRRVCNAFINSVLENTPSVISSGWVGTELVEILSAITASLHQGGKPVCIDTIYSFVKDDPETAVNPENEFSTK
jgi:predicted dehydrogenase